MNSSGVIDVNPSGNELGKKSRIKVILAVAIGLLLCIGIFITLVYLAVTQMRQLESPSRVSCPDVPAGWKQIASETLDTNIEKWPTRHSDEDNGMSIWLPFNDKYRGFVQAREGILTTIHPDLPIVEDFHLSVDAQKISGSDDSYYGIAFHMSHYNRYYFAISDTREYTASLYNGRWIRLIDWTDETIIKPGEVNKITVFADGPHYVLCVNDVFVADFNDDQKPRGFVGLTIGVENPGDEAKVEFDNFNLFVPEKP